VPLAHGPGSKPDFLVIANNALVPEMRLTMMGAASDLFGKTADTPVWRYVQQLEASSFSPFFSSLFSLPFRSVAHNLFFPFSPSSFFPLPDMTGW
jgi:hypothetical protein